MVSAGNFLKMMISLIFRIIPVISGFDLDSGRLSKMSAAGDYNTYCR